MPSYQYRKSHCGNKTILRPSYLHNGIFYTGKTTSLHQIRALVLSTTLSQSRLMNPKWHSCNRLGFEFVCGFVFIDPFDLQRKNAPISEAAETPWICNDGILLDTLGFQNDRMIMKNHFCWYCSLYQPASYMVLHVYSYFCLVMDCRWLFSFQLNSHRRQLEFSKKTFFDDWILNSELVCQKKVSRVETSKYIPQIIWNVIVYYRG